MMKNPFRYALVLLVLWPTLCFGQILEPGSKVAFLSIHYTDYSRIGELGEPPLDEIMRIRKTEDYVREQFRERGFEILSIEPLKDEMARISNIADCNGCEIRFGRQLGSDYVAAIEAFKVSNLVPSARFMIYDTESGEMVNRAVVDFRGNTDKAWQRAMRYMLRYRIFPE